MKNRILGTNLDVMIFLFYNYLRLNQRKPESRCPELLANYCDVLLRRNQTKKFTEDEVKEKLTNVVNDPYVIFRFF